MKALLPAVLALAVSGIAMPAAAQQRPAIALSYDMGLGLKTVPEYEGAEDYDTKPWLLFRNFDISIGGEASGDGTPAQGFSFGPAFDLVGKRGTGPDASPALRGLDPVDFGLEVGMRAGYRSGPLRVYGAARKSVAGHKGVTGELGVSLILHPAEKWTVVSSLEAQYGDRTYMEAYFGVSPDEAARTSYDPYPVGGGIKAHALTVETRYRATPAWTVLGRVQAKHLVGDAGDSPIVRDRDQISVGLGLVRSFNFRF